MSLSPFALAIPSPVTLTGLPTREWAQSVLLYYKSLVGCTFGDIARSLGLSEVWTTSAIHQQQQLNNDEAARLLSFLKVPTEHAAVLSYILQQPVLKGHLPSGAPPTDPCEYRLYEILQVYGSTFVALVNEKLGAGIMSAIDFHMTVDKMRGSGGEDRVRVELNGKFLPYKKW